MGPNADQPMMVKSGQCRTTPDSVRVMQTNGELIIARHTRDLLTG